jgi:hypothetical protein
MLLSMNCPHARQMVVYMRVHINSNSMLILWYGTVRYVLEELDKCERMYLHLSGICSRDNSPEFQQSQCR